MLISYASKAMLKICQARLQQYVKQELPGISWVSKRQRKQRLNCQYLFDHRKQENFRKKKICFFFINYIKAFVWITTNCGKFLKRWEYETTIPVSWGTCMQVKRQQLELYMEQWTGSKLGKEYDKAVYCHPACLTSL